MSVVRFLFIRSVVVILLTWQTAGAVERFPPPNFETGYAIPEVSQSTARSEVYEYLDVLALLVTLTLITFVAFRYRSRKGIFLIGVFSLAYFGFWREGCVCAIGSIQNIAMALFNTGYTVPLTVIAFFCLPIMFTLFFGRTFCAGVCPLGAIQDVVSVRPMRVPRWLEAGLGTIPFLYLGAAVLFAATASRFIICEYDPFVAFFRMNGSLGMFALGASFLLIGMVVERPYCRFFCPYGAILNLASRVAKWHVNITPSECIQCHLCAESCPLGVIRFPTASADLPVQATPAHLRKKDRRRLVGFLILLPVLTLAGGWAGWELGPEFSRTNARVLLAERIWLEDTQRVEVKSEESAAFRATGASLPDLHKEVLHTVRRFSIGGLLFGSFTGLVLGLKMVFLVVRRRRVDYEINRGGCVSCGRCFDYCPVGKEPSLEMPIQIERAAG